MITGLPYDVSQSFSIESRVAALRCCRLLAHVIVSLSA
jgi:hypothetical protein